MHVNALEVEQHPHNDVFSRCRSEQRLAEGNLAADVFLQQHPAIVLRKQRAAMEGIDDEASAGALADVRTPHQEVPWKVDSVDVQASPASDFHVHERQGDRDTGPTVKDIVET